jgi:hypothetical protein
MDFRVPGGTELFIKTKMKSRSISEVRRLTS